MTKDFTKLTDSEKQELVQKAYEYGYKYENQYGNCAQCVIAAIQDVFGVVDDSVFRAAHGLAGGTCSTTMGNCGALTGSVMVIGALQGREKSEFATGKSRKSYEMCRQIVDEFKDKYDGILCHQVQKAIMGRSYNLSDRKEYEEFEAAGGHDDKCTAVVGSAAKCIAEMIVNGDI